MNRFYFLLSIVSVFIFSPFDSVSQTGPAGVGNADGSNGQPETIFWLDAGDLGLSNNDPVSSWIDKSGNDNNLSQTGVARPTFKNPSDPNYSIPAVSFDGTDDFLPFNGNLLVGTDYTILLVGTRKSNGREVIMGGSVGAGNQNLHPYFNTNNLHSHQWGNDHDAGYTGGDGSSANAVTPDFGIFGFRLNSSLPTVQRAMYQNGQLIGTENDNAQLSAFVDAALGRFERVGEFSDIEIAELIIYADALNEAQQIIIQNYLSSKYNITLDANEFYAGDIPANGDYDFNVTGIGQQSGDQILTNSNSGFYLTAGSSLDVDGEFLMFGDDNTTNSVSTANLGATVEQRWAKTWFVDKSGTLDATIGFNVAEGIPGGLFPAGDLNNYVLLRENAGTFDIVPIPGGDKSLNAGRIEFNVSNADLIDGVYTLGTINSTDSPVAGEPNQTWYSRLTGNWNNPSTWTLDGSATPLPNNPGGEIPDATDNVVINSSTTVTLIDDNRNVSDIEVIGTLNIANTSGHNFTNIRGNGRIRLAGAGGIGNFPEGVVTDFSDSFIGGTVEYYGSGLTINDNRTFNDVVVNLSSAANDLVLMADMVLNGDLTISRGDLQINDNSSTTVKTIEVNGDVLVDANGAISVGTGNTIGTFSINPNNMPTSGNYHDIFHQVVFRGDFLNQGNVRFTNQTNPVYNEFTNTGAATVRFEGATNNSASLFGTTDFYNIVVDKGVDETFEIEINSNNTSNFSLYGPNSVGRNAGGGFTAANPEVRKALWIYRGTLHLTGSLSIPTLSEGNQNGGNGDYAIGATAGLWIDGPNVEVYSTADNAGQAPAGSVGINGGGSNQALSLYGKFRITDGVFGTRGSAGFIFWNADAGEVVIEGGTVNVSQFRSAGGGSGIYSYTQSGGEVLVRANEGQPGERSGAFSLFSLDTEDAVFNMSGGRLTVYGNDGEAIFINSGPGNFSVTGGTVRVENRDGTNAIVSTRVPFWDFEVARDQGGDAGEVDLITSTSGGNTITNPDLVVLNDFTIETGINFDHNGNDVAVGSDFTVSLGASYEFAESKPSTLTLNGTDNSTMALLNIDGGGGSGDVQRFYNLTINKPHEKVISLASSKSGGEFNSFQNNLFRVDGEAFKLLSGTLDQGRHSLLVNCDTLLNYDVLTVYNEALGTSGANDNDQNFNGNNDQIKLASNQGGPTDITLITADTAVIGNLKFFMQNFVVDLNSDLTIQYLEHNNGRFNIQDNKLKVTFYNQNVPGGGGSLAARGLTNMIVTDGNSSDGGLSLGVRANQTYTFPIGIGLTGSAPSSKYTPASVQISNFSDDGFVTIRPVDQVLATTDGTGGDILSYHWRVDYEDFTTEPTVRYNFTYYNDDLDGSGNEGSFVAGKVLEGLPFTRSYEDEVNGEFEGVNATSNVITFNGPNPDTGFTLENASYTAGESGRFVGAPTVYYSTTVNDGNDINFGKQDRWTESNLWSTVGHYSGTNTGTFPQAGDIAIMAFGLANPTSTTDTDGTQRAHWFAVDTDIAAAKLIFSEVVENANGDIVTNGTAFQPQLIIEADNAIDVNFGTVEGNGTFNVELDCAPCNIDPNSSTVIAPNISADFGLFADVPAARFDFDLYSGNNTSVYMPTDITSVFPNLQIKGQGGNGRRLVFESDVIVNRDLVLRQGGFLRLGNQAEGDAEVGRNLNMTINNDGDVVEFPLDGPGRVLTINGDINMDNNNDEITFRDNNNAGNVTINRLRVGGNINQATGQINLYSGAGPNRDQVELEIFGETDADYTRTNNPIASLYRLIVNKGNNRNSTFTFQDNFSLNGETDGIQKALELQNGTLILNDNAIDIDLTTGGDSFVIPATASLQITQGLANVSGDDSGIILDGSIIVDGGTLDMTGAGNGNNFIEYSASGNALLEISDGSLLVGSQIRPNSTTPSGVLNYNQTGGTVEVGVNAAPLAGRGVFEIINTGSSFTYTGGTLSIRRQNTATPIVSAIRILPTSSIITQPIIVDAAVGSQSNLGINANVPLAGLVVVGNNNPTVVTNINSLTLEGDLDIQTGASFNANGIDLILDADLINNGTFTASGNETRFVSETNQEISGANAVSFFDFTKTGIGSLDLVGNPVVVNGLFSHEEGIINDNGNIIELKGNAVIEGEISSAAGGELLFSAATQQQLLRLTSGVTDLGVVTITNPNGVVIPEGNGYDFNINGDLQMNGGIFNIGSSSVVIGQNADITTNSSFSITNMVRTNSSFSDNGLSKVFSPGSNGVFVFPVGEDDYTPVQIDFGSGNSGSSLGSIAVRPANEPHPVVNDGDNFFASGDVNNVLQYYWTLRSSGLSNFNATVSFSYDQSDVAVAEGGLTEANYIAARILAFNNPTEDINKYSDTEVDELSNEISFTPILAFNGVSSDGISGDYFAGIDEAIPDNVATYTTQAVLGDVTNTNTYIENLPTDGVAPSGAVLRVTNGTEITFNTDNVRLYKTIIEDGATLNVDDTDGHRLGILEGTGNLKITSNGSNAALPTADYGTFFSCSGGGLEYAGTGSYNILSTISSLRNLTLSGSGDRNFPNNDVTICEDLVVDGPSVLNPANIFIRINRDFIISGGEFQAGFGRIRVENNTEVLSGIYDGEGAVQKNFIGDIDIDGGVFRVGTSGITNLRGDISLTSGSFDGGAGGARFVFGGPDPQRLNGDFTGSNSFYRLVVNKNLNSVTLNGDIEISNILFLTSGNLVSESNLVNISNSAIVSPSVGRAESYINGKVSKPLNAGQNFTFPIGSANRWRPATLNGVNGGFTWEAQFFEGNVVTDLAAVDDMSSSDAAIQTIQQGEYYIISDNSTGGTASSVEISWGTETDVASGASDRGQLTVMVYNTSTNEWDNLGGAFPDGLGSPTQGVVRSASSQSFSEKIFVMGSTDPANPLPVEMTFFRAENKSNKVELKWQTASEKNNDFFEVQRSFDGKVFEVLGIVEGAGDSKESIDYGFNDFAPLAGESYYRLRQVDYDGAFEFSEVVRVIREQASDLIAVPNPTQAQNIKLRLSGFHGEQKVQVVIFDMQGKKHYEAIHSPADFNKPLPVDTDLNSGIYIVDVKQGNIRKKVRLMVR